VAVENGKQRITANTLALGLMANVADFTSEQLDRMLATVPDRRLGRPEEVGLLAAWLSSEGGGFITGQVIHLTVDPPSDGKSCSMPGSVGQARGFVWPWVRSTASIRGGYSFSAPSVGSFSIFGIRFKWSDPSA
jgi:Enoyl-(Acyl carrier protein) reductase